MWTCIVLHEKAGIDHTMIVGVQTSVKRLLENCTLTVRFMNRGPIMHFSLAEQDRLHVLGAKMPPADPLDFYYASGSLLK